MRSHDSETARRSRDPRRGSATLAIWLGAWGIVVSLVCIYVALDARNVAKDSERRLQRNVELLQESREKIERLEASVRETLQLSEERLEKLAFEVRKNTTRIGTNTDQLASTRKVASELIDNLSNQKEALTELATRIPAIPEGVQIGRVRTEPPPTQPAEPAPEPDGPPPAESRPTPPPDTYTVKSGDTLVDIARRKNLSVPALLDANPDIDPNLIRVGQKLNLPE